MPEHYVSLGWGTSWTFGAVVLLGTAIAFVLGLATGKPTVPRGQWLADGWLVVGSAAGLPLGWLLAPLGGVLGVGILLIPKTSGQRPPRLVVSSVAVFAIMFGASAPFWMRDLMSMSLTDGSVTWTAFGRTRTVPRVDLSVTEVQSTLRWVNHTPSASWDAHAYAQYGWEGHLFDRNEWFWGPLGFERGDAVGQRLKSWAGYSSDRLRL